MKGTLLLLLLNIENANFISIAIYEFLHVTSILGMCFIILTPRKSKKNTIFTFLIWSILITLLSAAVQRINSSMEYFPYVFFIVLYIPILVSFKEETPIKLYVFSSALMFTVIFCGFAQTLFVAIFRPEYGENMAMLIIFLLKLCITVITLALSYYMLKPLLSSLFTKARTDLWYLISLFPLVVSMILIIAFLPSPSFPAETLDEMSFLFWSVVVIFVYWFLSRYLIISAENSQAKQELEFSNKLLTMEKTYFAMLNDNLNKVRILKHDFRHHISMLYQFNDAEDREGLKSYLDNMNLGIAASDIIPLCSNETLNVILSYYMSKAAENNVELNVKVVSPPNLGIDATDLTIVLGNSIENALRAVKECHDNDKKTIKLACRYLENKFIIMVSNPYSGKIQLGTAGDILSTKPNGGLGIKSIQAVAAKYGGDVNIHYEDNVFSIYVTLFDQSNA